MIRNLWLKQIPKPSKLKLNVNQNPCLFKYKDIVEFEPESVSWKKATVNQKENTLQSTLSSWPKNMQRFEILEFVEWWGFNADLQLVEPFHVQRRKKIHMNSCPSQFWQAWKNYQRKIQFPTLASFWQAHTQVPNQLRKWKPAVECPYLMIEISSVQRPFALSYTHSNAMTE